jgi:glutamyl-tRNA synthetase
VQERLKKLSEIPELIRFFFERPKGYEHILVAKSSDKIRTKLALEESYEYLSKEDDFGRDSLEKLLRAVAEKNGLKAGELLWPIRVALTGEAASPGAFEVLEALGKDESLTRIKAALDVLK